MAPVGVVKPGKMPGGAATEVGPTLAIPRSMGTCSRSPRKGPVVRPILVRSLIDITKSSSLSFYSPEVFPRKCRVIT